MAIDIPPPIVVEKADVIDETLKTEETGYKIHHNVTPDVVNDIKSINDSVANRPNLVETDEHREGQNRFAIAEDVSRFLDDYEKNVLPQIDDNTLGEDETMGAALIPNEGETNMSVVLTNSNNEYRSSGFFSSVMDLSAGDVKGNGISPFIVRAGRTDEKFFGDKIYKDSKDSMKVRNSFMDFLRETGNAQMFNSLDGEDQALLASQHLFDQGYAGKFDPVSEEMMGHTPGRFMGLLMFSTNFLETGLSQENYNLGKRSNIYRGGDDFGAHQISINRYNGKEVDKDEIARHIDTNYTVSYALALETYNTKLKGIQDSVKALPPKVKERFDTHYNTQMLATLAAGGFNAGLEAATKVRDNVGTKANPKWKPNEDYFKALTGDLSTKPIKLNIKPENIGINIMRQVFTALDFQGEDIIGFEDLAKNPNTLPARILRMKITNKGETMTALEYVKKHRPSELEKAKALYSKNSIGARRQSLADTIKYHGSEAFGDYIRNMNTLDTEETGDE